MPWSLKECWKFSSVGNMKVEVTVTSFPTAALSWHNVKVVNVLLHLLVCADALVGETYMFTASSASVMITHRVHRQTPASAPALNGHTPVDEVAILSVEKGTISGSRR